MLHKMCGLFLPILLHLPPEHTHGVQARSIVSVEIQALQAREGVYAPGGPAYLAHTKQNVSNIVGLRALQLAFFMGYE